MEQARRKLISRVLCCLITYALLIQSVFVANIIYFSKIINDGNYFYLIYAILHLILVVMAIWTHYMCMTTNPGYIPMIEEYDVKEFGSNYNFCKKCSSYRPIGSHHCKTCNRCILRMDHHCVWICNCVGKFNQKFFLQYVMYIIVMSFLDILVIAINASDFITLTQDRTKMHIYFLIRDFPYVLIIFGCIAITFFLFTTIMLVDQMISIYKNRTGIDSLQKIRFQRIGFIRSLREICGETYSEVLLPICNKNDLYWGKDLTVIDILAIMSMNQFKLEEGLQFEPKQ